tara:strand:+ start:102 stop:314 length:213 start_codon:yes stop_codon:yes gene_type:complete
MNANPSIQAKKALWDKRVTELTDLVTILNYRMKDLAAHFNVTPGSIATVLHRRELTLIGMRHKYAKEKVK